MLKLFSVMVVTAVAGFLCYIIYHEYTMTSIGAVMAHEELATLQEHFLRDIPEEQLKKKITMPVEAKLKDLMINADQIIADAHHFESSGINWCERHTSILQGVAALRSAEEHYIFATQENAKAEMIWSENRAALYKWRRESMAHLAQLSKHKKDMELAQKLTEISDGDKHDDAIQDVNETTRLVEKHFDELAKQDLTLDRLTEARGIISKITQVFPLVMGEARGNCSARDLRDRAFWYLCNLERELKTVELPHVFRDDHVKRQEYESYYRRGLLFSREKV